MVYKKNLVKTNERKEDNRCEKCSSRRTKRTGTRTRQRRYRIKRKKNKENATKVENLAESSLFRGFPHEHTTAQDTKMSLIYLTTQRPANLRTGTARYLGRRGSNTQRFSKAEEGGREEARRGKRRGGADWPFRVITPRRFPDPYCVITRTVLPISRDSSCFFGGHSARHPSCLA